ncbi:hypothetical protein AB0J74_23635 [Asanoa sp. NPDC049573]|uniref:hypothetical protein n=1 Tax=Asanoa sp. NPDC049573 TaxID=3155396 RepID=UPI0034324DD5
MSPLRRLGRVRLSTIILAVVFVVAFVAYLFVRPDPEAAGGQAPPRRPVVDQRDDVPSPRPTTPRPTARQPSPTATPRPTETPSRPPSPSQRPTTRPTEPPESPAAPTTPPSPTAPAPSEAPSD